MTEDKEGPDEVPAAFKATMTASQPLFGSVQLVLYEPVTETMR